MKIIVLAQLGTFFLGFRLITAEQTLIIYILNYNMIKKRGGGV